MGPGVVNVHQGLTPGGSPQVLSVKALRNTEKKCGSVTPYNWFKADVVIRELRAAFSLNCAMHTQLYIEYGTNFSLSYNLSGNFFTLDMQTSVFD